MVERGALSGLCFCVLVTMPWTARGFQNEQAGFERLRFGASVADVKKRYATVRQLQKENLGAIVVESPNIVRYHIPNVQLQGLAKPVSLELRFWNEKLWVVIGYFGDNSPDEVMKYLRDRYGPPTSTKPDPAWRGQIAVIASNSKQKWFSVADQVASKEISARLIESMNRMQGQRPATSHTAPPTAAVQKAAPTP
ncbi:MAG TPA: hypothetical protein VMW17_15775 [Candidatus Binatia bacterium]|nr:hypothetical protein [Candidatus Binatia bacterium]